MQPQYIGRFAPSPSGPLHMGSLVCALASYLDAKAHFGQWLIRIEDIDPPREPAGASDAILQCLQVHHLHSDQPILFQSSRSKAYQAHLSNLSDRKLSYCCQCTRRVLRKLDGRYDGRCRSIELKTGAIRLNIKRATELGISSEITFEDTNHGRQGRELASQGDFVIHRKDGLFAYQLAVVSDDMFQQISHVVRGDDLLETTFAQQLLFKLFDYQPPQYHHIPVLLGEDGRKLSKQNGAPAVDLSTPLENLRDALRAMGFNAPDCTNIDELLTWATNSWADRYIK